MLVIKSKEIIVNNSFLTSSIDQRLSVYQIINNTIIVNN